MGTGQRRRTSGAVIGVAALTVIAAMVMVWCGLQAVAFMLGLIRAVVVLGAIAMVVGAGMDAWHRVARRWR